LIQLKKKVVIFQDHPAREVVAKNLEAGKAFLEMNKTKEGGSSCQAVYNTGCCWMGVA
jgi:hypothetical protein